MVEMGLRERKKAKTRQTIAATAARLFAEHGYEQVSVADVARAAEVSQQTVFNYFATKEQLVTDGDETLREEMSRLIRDRTSGMTAAAAIRPLALDVVDGIERVPREQWRGELGYLAAISPAVNRLVLEMSARQATAISDAIAAGAEVSPELAELQGIALAGVFQIIVTDAGQRARQGQDQREIAIALRLAVSRLIDELDSWFSHGRKTARS